MFYPKWFQSFFWGRKWGQQPQYTGGKSARRWLQQFTHAMSRQLPLADVDGEIKKKKEPLKQNPLVFACFFVMTGMKKKKVPEAKSCGFAPGTNLIPVVCSRLIPHIGDHLRLYCFPSRQMDLKCNRRPIEVEEGRKEGRGRGKSFR